MPYHPKSKLNLPQTFFKQNQNLADATQHRNKARYTKRGDYIEASHEQKVTMLFKDNEETRMVLEREAKNLFGNADFGTIKDGESVVVDQHFKTQDSQITD